MKTVSQNRSGFTIVELLIVIVVIAILAAISIVAYNGIQQRARDTSRVSDIAAIEKSLLLYGAESGNFTVMSAGSGGDEAGWFDTVYSTYPSVKTVLVSTGYLNNGIIDPQNIKVSTTSTTGSYAYMISKCTTADDTRRVIMARLENAPSKTIAQQTSPLTCNDGSFNAFTGSPGAGYGMNYARVITLQ